LRDERFTVAAQATGETAMSIGTQTVARDSYFKRHWRGELSLPRSYWINGFLIWALGINLLCVALLTASVLALRGRPALLIGACLVEIAFQIAVYIWALVGIWRSAVRYPGPKFWSILARVLISIGVLLSLRVVGQDLHVISMFAHG
jgi:hypothetical protein